jgi:hypothetical protein
MINPHPSLAREAVTRGSAYMHINLINKNASISATGPTFYHVRLPPQL